MSFYYSFCHPNKTYESIIRHRYENKKTYCIRHDNQNRTFWSHTHKHFKKERELLTILWLYHHRIIIINSTLKRVKCNCSLKQCFLNKHKRSLMWLFMWEQHNFGVVKILKRSKNTCLRTMYKNTRLRRSQNSKKI